LPRKLVVAGLIAGPEGVLITQRPPGGPIGLRWEFPGGKIEPGESPEVALARELEEEIAARVEVGRVWDVLYHPYPDFELIMLVYHARLLPGESPACREVQDMRWVTAETIADADILEADEPLVARIQRDGVPEFVASLLA
jgi:8-oxo-dGTP diphosphatase